jgi:ribokinase
MTTSGSPSKKSEHRLPEFLVFGNLSRNFIIDLADKAHNDIPGGSALFAAAGIRCWGYPVGIVCEVGEDFPLEMLHKSYATGMDFRGVKVLPQAIDARDFYVGSNADAPLQENPIPHYSAHHLPFPTSLLGYSSQAKNPLRDPNAVHPHGIGILTPQDYQQATAVHLCAMNYRLHVQIPVMLRKSFINIITIDPSPDYMLPKNWDNLPALLKDTTAFLPHEKDIVALFQGRSNDIWEMAQALAEFGCDFIVIRRGLKGQYLYDGYARKRYFIPAYPVKATNLVGTGDAFCGGFLANYKKSYDPLEACLAGNISSSLAMQSENPLFMADTMPGFCQARKESLRLMVQTL